MLFNLKDKVIFISVPKTASTAIENYILQNSCDYKRNFVFNRKKLKLKLTVPLVICTKFLENNLMIIGL